MTWTFIKYFNLIIIMLLFSVYAISFTAIIDNDRAVFQLGNNEIHIGKCYIKEVTHLDCPGCGLTRSFISISHGNIIDSIHYNPAGIVAYFCGILICLNGFYYIIKQGYIRHLNKIIAISGTSICIIMFINWIVKIRG